MQVYEVVQVYCRTSTEIWWLAIRECQVDMYSVCVRVMVQSSASKQYTKNVGIFSLCSIHLELYLVIVFTFSSMFVEQVNLPCLI